MVYALRDSVSPDHAEDNDGAVAAVIVFPELGVHVHDAPPPPAVVSPGPEAHAHKAPPAAAIVPPGLRVHAEEAPPPPVVSPGLGVHVDGAPLSPAVDVNVLSVVIDKGNVGWWQKWVLS